MPNIPASTPAASPSATGERVGHLRNNQTATASMKAAKRQLDRARLQTLLQCRRAGNRHRRRQPDESRVADVDVTVDRVGDHAGDCGDPDRRERRRRRGPSVPAAEEQQRNDHDAAPDPEQRTEEARHEADEDEPHAPILAAWICWTGSPRIRAGGGSSSTSTACSHRSSRGRRMHESPTRRAPSFTG